MKKFTVYVLTLFMLISFVSCSGEAPLPKETEPVTVSQDSSVQTEAETTESAEVTETLTETTTEVTASITEESTDTEDTAMIITEETTNALLSSDTETTTTTATEATTTESVTTAASETTAAATTQTAVQTTVTEEPKQEKNLFVHVEGSKIVDGSGKPYQIKGMAFGNNVWGNPSTPVSGHHTEDSYRMLSEMGFNSIRFYINYGIFESDSAPYKYKQSGFDYLDKNIEWAKKYNIKLIINMHYPQGGYQSQGNGMELWTNPENQRRLTKLWGEIARRYADETAIIGFGLVNEPYLAALSTDEATVNQWKKLAQGITDEIRKYDDNHIVFVEKMLAAKDVSTGQSQWYDLTGEDNLFLINDDNAVYEFHNYSPHSFTHQNAAWAGTDGQTCSYPNGVYASTENEKWQTFLPKDIYADVDTGGWQHFSSGPQTVPSGARLAVPTFSAAKLGSGGAAYVDNIVIKEYNSAGAFVRTVLSTDYSNSSSAYYWSADGTGSGGHTYSTGYNGGYGCVSIAGSMSDAVTSLANKSLTSAGNYYTIEGYIKLEKASSAAKVQLRMEFYTASDINYADKAWLEQDILKSLEFGIKHNVPMYLGEFGCIKACFDEDRGGDRWVSDMLDICNKYDLSYNYHTFHESGFGLYLNDSDKLPDKLNKPLYDIFKKKLAE